MNIGAYENCLVIDLTHGGVKIACKIKKKIKNVYAYDIYNTLKKEEKELLKNKNIKVIDNLNDLCENTLIIAPIHSPLKDEDFKNTFKFITHHKAVKLILKEWLDKNKDILKIEVTGVKGKTSSTIMLNEIFKNNYNTLILSSLGAYLFKNKKEILLKKDISITPANILETIDLADDYINDSSKYKIAIFENSLGASGIGDIGLLTNLIENYKIANNKKDARYAKSQIFKCKMIVCDAYTLNKYYKKEAIKYADKINTYSLNNNHANLILKEVEYNLDKTKIKIEYTNLKTIDNKRISGLLEFSSFALGMPHIQNILGVVTSALTLNTSHDMIINGLENFKGIKGRSSIKKINNNHIISEINPGINTESIKSSIEMIDNLDDYYIIIGGEYGVSCEEINEEKLAIYLDNLSKKFKNIILTGDVGSGILDKMENKLRFIDDYSHAQELAINNKKNILFIYRSNYNELTLR